MEEHRDKTRERRLPPGYSGVRHLMILFSFCLVVSVVSVYHVRNVTLGELLIIPITFLYGNLCEYLAHKYPLHRRPFQSLPALRALHKSHTGVHHKFYNYNYMTATRPADWYFTLFPLKLYALFLVLFAIPCSAIVFLLFSANARNLFFMSAMLYLAMYELFHSMHHDSLPAVLQHFLNSFAFMQSLKTHHRLHHHWRLQHKYNFNITVPLFDYVFGTKYTGEAPEEYRLLTDEQRAAKYAPEQQHRPSEAKLVVSDPKVLDELFATTPFDDEFDSKVLSKVKQG